MADEHGADVLIVSLGSTQGLRTADDELAAALRRAGASVAIAQAQAPPQVRTLMLTDLAWARAARRAHDRTLAALSGAPRATVYSSTTAALLWRTPGAIRFDAAAAGNRRGRHGLWQRPLERLRLTQAPLLLPWSEGALAEAAPRADAAARAIVLPVAVEPSGADGDRERDITAITYAANPRKKGLDVVLAAWRRALAARPRPDAQLLVAGVPAERVRAAGIGLEREPGVRLVGELPPAQYRSLLRRSRLFLSAARREDYGIAQLEALADGCMLLTTPSPGPYAALSIARALDPRLVDLDLATALCAALDDPLPGYRARALELLAPFRPDAVDRVVAERLLPRLLA